MLTNNDPLLRAILSMIARQTFPVEKLAEIVISGGAGTKQRQAFNLCDGTKSQSEIAKVLKLDAGNFSRTVARWIESGIVMRLGSGREATLLHVYPLPSDSLKPKGARK